VDKLTPGNVYLVINTTENHFSLYKNRKIILEGICSTGSLVSLEGENKKWVFKTPRGDHKVLGKLTKPVWRKPDWAFVEEGLPIPSANHPSRYEKGTLGDYALAIGNGYLIHGTLYQRFLGLPVTHGCIRMGDKDLKQVYETLQVGSKVFIY
jgi:lipoprotein-anchoring transpeptidase ErfK/SrfK